MIFFISNVFEWNEDTEYEYFTLSTADFGEVKGNKSLVALKKFDWITILCRAMIIDTTPIISFNNIYIK